MMDNIDELTDKRLRALKKIENDKVRVARDYNKKIKGKSFQVGELVWKTFLPLGMKSNKFSKCRLVAKVYTRMLKLSSGIHIWLRRC